MKSLDDGISRDYSMRLIQLHNMNASIILSSDNTKCLSSWKTNKYALEVILSQSKNRQLPILRPISEIHNLPIIFSSNYDHVPSIVNTSRFVKCLYSDSLATLRRSLRVLIVCSRLEKTQYTIPVSHSARGITAIRSELVCSTSCDVWI